MLQMSICGRENVIEIYKWKWTMGKYLKGIDCILLIEMMNSVKNKYP